MVFLAKMFQECSDILSPWHLFGSAALWRDQPSEALPRLTTCVTTTYNSGRTDSTNQTCSHLFHILLLLLPLDSSLSPPLPSSHLVPSAAFSPPKPELSFLPGGGLPPLTAHTALPSGRINTQVAGHSPQVTLFPIVHTPISPHMYQLPSGQISSHECCYKQKW